MNYSGFNPVINGHKLLHGQLFGISEQLQVEG